MVDVTLMAFNDFLDDDFDDLDFSVLEALEAQHLAARGGGGAHSLQGSRLPAWTGRSEPEVVPGTGGSNRGQHVQREQPDIPARMPLSHSGPHRIDAEPGAAHPWGQATAGGADQPQQSWSGNRRQHGSAPSTSAHHVGAQQSKLGHTSTMATAPTHGHMYPGAPGASNGSAAGADSRYSAVQHHSNHAGPWQQPPREQRPPVRTTWEPGGHTQKGTFQSHAGQPHMQAPFGRGEDPVSTSPSSAPAQQVFLGAAAQHTSTEQPRSDGISAPAPFEWNDWQPDAGDEATDWDYNTGAGPAEWVEGAGRCSEGREPPEGEKLGDAATDMDAERQGMHEEGAAAAADDEPRLMQFNSTNKGILVDTFAAKNWIYPEGVPERAYQVAIVEQALLKNTLVCLPTGLGKTFIAAVVMYNFFRWFPEGKVVFLAPTKPLVHQQMDACQKFMGSSKGNSIVLDGGVNRENRIVQWDSPHKRIIFATPQTFKNDVCTGVCPLEKITCVVVDECHRAVGKNDAVAVIEKLRSEGCKFRVLGLSATPGSKREAVQEVLQNLMISAIEFRGEEDADVVPYRHATAREMMVVEPSREVGHARAMLLSAFRHIMAELCRSKMYFGNADAETVTRFGLQQAQQQQYGQKFGPASVLFRQAMLLADLRDHMDLHGLGQAQEYLNEKLGAENNSPLRRLLDTTQEFREFQARLDHLVRSAAAHPKMAALQEVILAHFSAHAASADAGRPTRVIVFTNLRDSVHQICDVLRKHEPLIKARMFIGQGAGSKRGAGGMKQLEQKKVLADFRAGLYNTMVATCIGEEGLDIPQVDLVLCYDANASPIRDIQRSGRTGRHREGKVIHIMAAGKEEQSYKRQQLAAQDLHRQLRRQDFELYKPNPRMLPRKYEPRQLKADVSSTSPAKEASSGSGASGRGRAGRRSGSAAGRGHRRGRARGGAGDASSAGAEAPAPPTGGAAVSPRSRWRGPAKGSARGGAARRGRPAGPRPAHADPDDDNPAEQAEAPVQAPAAKAAPMSLKERIAANNASRNTSVVLPARVAEPAQEGPIADPDVTVMDSPPAEEDRPDFGDDTEPSSRAAGVDCAAAVESEEDLMEPLFIDSDDPKERDGSADAAGDVEVASLQEPAHEAQCVAPDASAAERIMAALPFPDCADFISVQADMSIRVKSPPPELLAAVFGLPTAAPSSDVGRPLEAISAQDFHAAQSDAASSTAAWLADLHSILCGDQSQGDDEDGPAAAQPGTRDPAEKQAGGGHCQGAAQGSAAMAAALAEAGARKEGKQPRRGSKGEKRASASAQPEQQKRQKKAAKDAAAARRKDSEAAARAAELQAAEAAVRGPQMSLTEKMQLASRAQQQMSASAAAAELDCLAGAHQVREAPPATFAAGLDAALPETEQHATSSHSTAAEVPEADAAEEQSASDGDGKERLSQQPLLQRLQNRLRQAKGNSATDRQLQPSAANASLPERIEVGEGGEHEETLSQVPLAERVSVRAAHASRHSRHALSTAVPRQDAGLDAKAAQPDACTAGADFEVCKVLDSDTEAEVVALSQMPLASRLPRARSGKPGPLPARAAADRVPDSTPAGTHAHSSRPASTARDTRPGDMSADGGDPVLVGSSTQRGSGTGEAQRMQPCRAQQSTETQAAQDRMHQAWHARPSPAIAARCQLLAQHGVENRARNAIEGPERVAVAEQQSKQRPQPESKEAVVKGNWDLLDDLGGLDFFSAPPSPGLKPPLETPCATVGAAAAGASAEEPSTSPALAVGRPAARRGNVLWSPEEATPLPRPPEHSRPTDPGDSTGGFRRPVARRKRAILDSCTPGEPEPEGKRKLKRLSKHRDVLAAAAPGNDLHAATPAPAKKTNAGKIQRRLMAAAFIDGEAEVSDDEDMSGDEDGEDDDMLSDLIDDETQPFGSVQPKKQSEMMAVYRDSLRLHTPTPLKQRLARFAARGPGRTPLGPVPENQSPAPSEPFFDSPYDLSGSFIATEGEASQHIQTQHEDVCGMCHDDGELLCCDGCPAAFHLSCLGLTSEPAGDWFCAVCRDG